MKISTSNITLKQVINRLPLFILWPFGAMLHAFRNFRQPASKFIVWLFFVFFGFVFIHSYYYGKDAYSYVEGFMDYHNYWMGFESLKKLFYSGDSKYVDVYQPLITWIVAYFTGNPRWLFTAFAAVFGYFYVQNIWIILSKIRYNYNKQYVLIFLIISFILINPIWNINGVRMGTAMHVFYYGLLKYMLNKEKNGVFWIISSMFFHFSFLFPISLFIVYRFIPKNLTFLLIFFLATSFIRELDLSALRSSLSFLPDFFQDRVSIYTSDTYYESISAIKKEASIHEKMYDLLSKLFLYSWVVIVYSQRNKWLNSYSTVKNFFTFGLFFGGFAQIATNVPSGGRFMAIVSLIFYAVFIFMVSEKNLSVHIKRLQHVSTPVLLFLILFQIRIGFDYCGISTLISNPIVALYFEDKVPLIEFVKGLL